MQATSKEPHAVEIVRELCQRCEALEREVKTWKNAYHLMVREWDHLARKQEQSNG